MADTQRYRFPPAVPDRFNYAKPVRDWPYAVRVRWPNTILELHILQQAGDAAP